MFKSNEIAAFFLLHGIHDENDSVKYGDIFTKASEKIISLLRETEDDFRKDEEIQFDFYEVGKEFYGDNKNELKLWFQHLYYTLYGTKSGARWGMISNMLGVTAFCNLLENRIANVMFIPVRDKGSYLEEDYME